ncbi:MAG: hypothetical protein NWF13_00505 [Candidatus Bathyarchaeota archaeon]|nr:hypothetical protein [Candidatus Bathyarchaeota archaeon]
MESDSGYREKMDALDLIMNALKDHEKRLDEISYRLEQAFEEVKTGEPREVEGAREVQRVEAPPRMRSPQVLFSKWSEFKGTCKDGTMVAFEVDENQFHVSVLVDRDVFTYKETLPNTTFKVVEEQSSFSIGRDTLNHIDALDFLIEGKLKCGLTLVITSTRTLLKENEYLFELRYGFKPDEVKTFLSRELGVLKDKIVEGKITI